MRHSTRLRAGDPVRALLAIAVLAWAVAAGPVAAIPLALVVPPVVAIRFLPVPGWLDAGLCLVVTIEATAWWDGAAHGLTAALLGAALASATGCRGTALAVVAALALGWEVLEWGSDLLAGTDLSPGLDDTLVDIAVGLAGGGAGVLLARATHSA